MNPTILSVRNLSVSLPAWADRPYAVENLSLDIAAGEILCVVGESGSGKSTCANALMGLLGEGTRISQGQILFQGEELNCARESRMRELRGDRIAMIFQEPMTSLNPLMRIEDQVIEVFKTHGRIHPSKYHEEAVRLFSEVHLPDPEMIGRSYPFKLSGGQRQRVLIAMALAFKPALLIADEPTTALDVTTQAQILKLILELRENHDMGVMFITHDFGVVAEIADRVVVMNQGRIVETGTTESLMLNPQEPYTRRLIAAIPSITPSQRHSEKGDVILKVRNLKKTYVSKQGIFGARNRQVNAVQDISLNLRAGETLGVVGESGSGKSTLGRLIIRLLDPDEGQIIVNDQDITQVHGRKLSEMRRCIQFVFQDPYASLNPRHTIERTLRGALHMPEADALAIRQRCAELLQHVGLDAGALQRYPHEFSGGQRQRIAIARALAGEPRILIADEAVSALDVSVQAQVLRLLDDLQKQLGLSIIFITHDLRVAAQICDRVMVMHRGKVVECEEASLLFTEPKHDYTRRLLSAIPGQHLHAKMNNISQETRI